MDAETRDRVTYINAIIDRVIELFEKTSHCYRERRIFMDVFDGDEEVAAKEWLHFCHHVSECHPRVIMFCERICAERKLPIPPKPDSLRLHLQLVEKVA